MDVLCLCRNILLELRVNYLFLMMAVTVKVAYKDVTLTRSFYLTLIW